MCSKILRVTLLAAFAICGVSNVQAASPFPASPLQSVVVHDFGNQVLLYLPAAVSNGEGCANNNLLVVEKAHPFFKEMFAAGLSTFQANTKITGWVHGCNLTFGAPVLIRLDMVR